MPYQYQPLPIEDPNDIFIRLFELHKGPAHGPITGRLYTTRLSRAPPYHALSYCWGSSVRSGTVHITTSNGITSWDIENDNTLSIPGALIPFLRQTRQVYRVQSRTLWIDSICINQEDPEEKNIHVPHMREVYVNAKLTICWLGKHENGSKEALQYAIEIGKMYRRWAAKKGFATLTTEEEKDKDVQVPVKVGDPALEAFWKLLDRAYWERAWIVQEVVVSSQVVVMCGDSALYYITLLSAYLYLTEAQTWLLEFYNANRIRHVVELRLSELDWQAAVDIPWHRVLLRHRWNLSGDPRDKVFAFYGLRCKTAFEELGIRPNYHESSEVLYTKLAVGALRKKEVLILHVPRLVIGEMQQEDPLFESINIPSWVPDWRSTADTPQSMVNGEGYLGEANTQASTNFSATKDSKLEIVFGYRTFKQSTVKPKHAGEKDSEQEHPVLPSYLRLHGVTIARVTELTRSQWVIKQQSNRNTFFSQAKLLQFNMNQIHDWESVLPVGSAGSIYPPTGELVSTVKYDTFMGGARQFSSEQRASAVAGFERRQKFLRVFYTLQIHGFLVFYLAFVLFEGLLRYVGYKNPEMTFRMMVGHMANRKGARMACEFDKEVYYYALVPGICKLGDYVVLVEGVQLPLLLRLKEGEEEVQVEGGETRKGKVWEFIGDAYVHGAMKGDVWEKRKNGCEDFWVA
ncbi:hypothetical protein IQ07DRAFT_592350 [Pyrenochaeta sp. DS3sAY3a]|nr:hypothetical protein IQ07DRAFT_592350 [Pyrenochaeta sp. DS3sAY3a]